MGRPRQHDKHLPRRMRFKHGAYRFRSPEGREITLGRSYDEALHLYADLVNAGKPNLLGDVIDLFMKERMPALAASTARRHRYALAPLREVFGHMHPASIKPSMIYEYRTLRPPISANREVSLLSNLMNLAIEHGLIDTNPCRQVRRLTERPRDRYIEDWEYRAVREIAAPPIQIAMDLAILTGLRLGDLLSLRLDAAKKDGLHLDTSKTGKRIILEWTPLLTAAIDSARAYPGPNHTVRSLMVVVNRRGQPYTVSGFASVWQKLQRRALREQVLQERFRFHDLRAKSTERATDPQQLLGHDNPAITNRVYRRHPRRVMPSAGIWDNSENMGQGE